MSTSQNQTKWFNLNQILSYSTGIYYFCDTVRNIGKTWGLQKYAWRRAYKHGKKVIIVRRFKKEAQECAESLYESRDVKEFCTGLQTYDPETKKGNFKKRGRTFYIKRNKKWQWFCKVINLSQFKNLRSSDDIDCDTIIYDEYTTTPEKYRMYRGNEVENFIDLTITICRQHAIRVIFCGNKESVNNPYYTYFNIPPLPENYEGIRTYRKGSLIVQQYNTPIYTQKAFLNRLNSLLAGTVYGSYLFNATVKNAPSITYKKPPKGAEGYLQLYWQGSPLKLQTAGDTFYLSENVDTTITVFTDKYYNNLHYQSMLNRKQDRNKFRAFQKAYLDNKIFYTSARAHETAKAFAKWLGIVNTG